MRLDEMAQSKEIDGLMYTVTPLPFGIGQKVLMRLIRVVSPLLAASADGGAAVFAALPSVLKDEDIEFFGDKFGAASSVAIDGKNMPMLKQNQELHFAGKYLAFMQWLMFSIEVNYKSFFVGLTNGGAGVADLVTAMNPNSSKSTPGNG